MTVASFPVFQSKWGYHPCDKETFHKLRKLNYLAYLSRKAEIRYDRWAAKLPHNRIQKQWVRNTKGQKIHAIPGAPIPEPKHGCVSLCAGEALNPKYRFLLTPLTDIIAADYRRARYPKPNPESVEKLYLSNERIDALLKDGQKWASELGYVLPNLFSGHS